MRAVCARGGPTRDEGPPNAAAGGWCGAGSRPGAPASSSRPPGPPTGVQLDLRGLAGGRRARDHVQHAALLRDGAHVSAAGIRASGRRKALWDAAFALSSMVREAAPGYANEVGKTRSGAPEWWVPESIRFERALLARGNGLVTSAFPRERLSAGSGRFGCGFGAGLPAVGLDCGGFSVASDGQPTGAPDGEYASVWGDAK